MCFKFTGIQPEEKTKEINKEVIVDPIKDQDFIITYQLNKLSEYSVDQLKFLKKSLDYQRDVLNSAEFKYRFIGMRGVRQTQGMSLTRVYKEIMSGKNNLSQTVDFDLDYILELYIPKRNSTLGYTVMGGINKGKIYTNKFYFNRCMKRKDYHAIAGHLFHEYLHSMNLVHKFDFGRKRQSVVYKGGYLMREMVLEIMNGKKLTKVKQ